MVENTKKIVVVSGGFDPMHIGHVRLFEEAKKLGNKLVVIVNSDQFLLNKKGYVFMPLNERMEIVASVRYVDEVVVAIDKDQTVCETLRMLSTKYSNMIFANGGDRKSDTTPEVEVCDELQIEMVFNLVGVLNSSSKLVEKWRS